MPLRWACKAKLMMRAVADATGRTEDAIRRLYDERGDIGTVAGEVLPAEGSGALPDGGLPPALRHRHGIRSRGAGAEDRGLLADLLRRLPGPRPATSSDRAGPAPPGRGRCHPILDAMAAFGGAPSLKEALERCCNLSSDLGLVARVLR